QRYAVAELGHAVGMAGDATLARLPMAGGQVVQYLPQTVGAQGRGQILLGKGIGKQVLHGVEARGPGGGEALHEGQLGEEHGEIGGELGHVVFLSRAWQQWRWARRRGKWPGPRTR